MKYLLAAFFVFCFQVSLFAEAPLRVGMELSYPPFEMTDGSGAPMGVSVDLAKALGVYLHREVEIENMPFEGLIPALKVGRIDLVISSLTITAERSQSVSFSDPYCRSGLALLIGKNSSVHTVADLNQPGRLVVVKTGTTGALFAAAHLPRATILSFQQANACALEVSQGKADAFIYDQLSVEKYHQKMGQTQMNLVSFQEEPWGFGIRKGNEDLRSSVNAFLSDFRAKGGFDLLRDKYFQAEEISFKAAGIPFYF